MAERAIDFEFGHRLELELRPAADGVEAFECGSGILQITGGEDGLVDAAT